MKQIRKLLVLLFGLKFYLKLVSKTYILLTNMGFMRKKYPELFYLDTLIQPDWICIDIGANLGYYSNRIGRKLTTGKLYAVEPIPLFAEVWKSNLANSKCTKELLNIALGDENKAVTMSIPIRNGVVRHGLTKIDDEKSNSDKKAMSFEVSMKKSGEVFHDLDKIDFIKIDVEGYEQYVLKSLISCLEKNHPIIQAELSGEENKNNSYQLLTSIGYQAFRLINNKLTPFSEKELSSLAQDVYFIHSSQPLN